MPRTRIERIAAEKIGITADTALRLGKANTSGADAFMPFPILVSILSLISSNRAFDAVAHIVAVRVIRRATNLVQISFGKAHGLLGHAFYA